MSATHLAVDEPRYPFVVEGASTHRWPASVRSAQRVQCSACGIRAVMAPDGTLRSVPGALLVLDAPCPKAVRS